MRPTTTALLLAAVVLCSPLRARAVDPALLAEDPNGIDVVFSPAIQAKADALGNDPVRIYEFVRNELGYQVYWGLMKGPDATLQSGRGNDYDLATLLVSMLRHSGIPARFVRGFIQVSTEDARAWTGAVGTNGPLVRWLAAEPPGWTATPLATAPAYSGAALVGYTRLHVWVEALVPMAHYRGRDVDPGDERGRTWIPLDPSFKLATWGPATTDPLGIGGTSVPADLQFQYGTEESPGATPYYSTLSSKLPAEIYEDQVRAHLAATPLPDGSYQSLEDVLFRPTTVREEPGVLPTGLANPVIADATHVAPTRSARLAELHAALSPSPLAGQLGEPDYHYTWRFHLCRSPSSTSASQCRDMLASHSKFLARMERSSAALAGRRVSLTFLPGEAIDPELGLVDGPNSCSKDVIPTFWVDGVPQTLTGVQKPEYCDSLRFVIEVRSPLDTVYATAPDYTREVEAGGIYALAIDAEAAGPARTREAADTLVHALEQDFPTAEQVPSSGGDPRPFVLASPGHPNGNFLAVNFEAQEALFGGMLDLVAARYFELLRDGQDRLSALHHHFLVAFPARGLAISGLELEFLFDVPYSARPDTPLIDVLVGNSLWARNGGNGDSVAIDQQDTLLIGHHSSAVEHAAWEDVTGLESISTVRGFQLLEANDQEIASVHNENEAFDLMGNCPQILVYDPQGNPHASPDATCDDVDVATYCALKAAFAGELQLPPFWKALWWDEYVCPDPTPFVVGNDVVREVRIAPKSLVDYLGWQGHMFFWHSIKSWAFAIAQGATAGGAYAVGTKFALDPWKFSRSSSNDFAESLLYGFDKKAFQLNDGVTNAIKIGDPVAVTTGNLSHVEQDLEIAGPGGFPLRFVRSYNSRSDYTGSLGHGWIHTFEQHVRIDDDDPSDVDVVWVDENGIETGFDNPALGVFVARPWIHHRLTADAETGGYLVTTQEGIEYRFLPDTDSDGKALLHSITDRNGNRISCVYDAQDRLTRVWLVDAPLSANDRYLNFAYESGYLRKLTDHTGRHWRYTVDADGNLASYLDPQEDVGLNRPTRYAYWKDQINPDLDHNLRCVVMPEDRVTTANPDRFCDQLGGDVWMEFFYYSNDTAHRHTSSLGETTTYSYDWMSRRTTSVQPDASIETYTFDRFGNVTRHESARGVARNYEYDPEARDRTRERDGFGLETVASYQAGNLKTRKDRLGNTESWSHDFFGQPTRHVDRTGAETRWEYDANGNLVRELAELDGALRVLREHAYDARGNRTETTEYSDPEGGPGHTTRFYYDATGSSLLRVVDAAGSVTRFTADALSRPTQVEQTLTLAEGQAPRRIVTSTVYDHRDRAVRQVDSVGVAREVEFDANGNLVESSTVSPLPGQPPRIDESNAYDAADRLIESEDTLGAITRFQHDERGRLIQVTSPLGHRTRFEYDADGNRTAEIDPKGARWRYAYDAEGRLIRATDPLGVETRTSYDAEGRVLETKRVAGTNTRVLATYVLDEEGRPTRVADGDGFRTQVEYDELGRRTRVSGPFNPDGSPTSAAEFGEVLFSYDLEGRLLSKTDPAGRTWRHRYDLLGRLVEAGDPLARATVFERNEAGHLLAQTNAAGERILLEYDLRGRLVRRRSVAAGIDDRFAYDLLGRMSSAANAQVTYTLEHDALDRPVALRDPMLGTARRAYDLDGRITQVVYPAAQEGGAQAGFSEGIVTHYRWDARGQLTSVVDPAGGTWQFAYDAAGRPVMRRFPGNVRSEFAYDAQGFLASIEIFDTINRKDILQYQGYDARGNPATICERIANCTEKTQVSYDALGRITQTSYFGGTSESFQYDAAGTRTQHIDRTGMTRRYIHDAGGQLARIENAATSAVIEQFQYDVAGRRVQRAVTGGPTIDYGYDPLGRLASVDQTGSSPYSLDLAYDPAGHRRMRTDASGISLYLGEWLEQRGGKRVRLVHAPGIDDVLAEVEDTTTDVPRHLFADAAGNVVQIGKVTGATGTIETTHRYLAFGETRIAPSAAVPVERGFAGRPSEGASNLLYLRARHYDPLTGQFLQPDPLGIATDHTYAYARSNPYVYSDPWGLIGMQGKALNASLSGAGSIAIGSASSGPMSVGSAHLMREMDRAGGALMTAARFEAALPADSVAREKELVLLRFVAEGVDAVGVQGSLFPWEIIAPVAGATKMATRTMSLGPQLQRLTTRAAREIDALGDAAFSSAQLRAIQSHSNLRAAYRGFQIDKRVRTLVGEVPELAQRLSGRINRGVDFTDNRTREIFEMTTRAQTRLKQLKYGSNVRVLVTD